jgi:prepilin-type processing-associated H-X9-DG protein
MSSTPSNQGTSGKAIASLVLGILSIFCIPLLPALGGLLFGFLGLQDIKNGRASGKGIAIAGLVTSSVGIVTSLLVIGLFVATFYVRGAANRVKSQNTLKQLGLAVHMYNDTFQTFPSPNIGAQPGQQELSWRVAMLPYIEEQGAYSQFDQGAAWDSPRNQPLSRAMPQFYAHPEQDLATRSQMTHYQAVVGPTAFFERDKPHHIADCKRGLTNTIMIVEAGEPVIWSKPQDVNYSDSQPLPKLGVSSSGFNVLFADGHVQFFPKGTDEKVIRELVKRD